MIEIGEKKYKDFGELFNNYSCDIQSYYLLEKAVRDIRQACFEIYTYVDDREERRIKDAEMALVTALFEISVKYDCEARREASKMRELINEKPGIQCE